MKTKPSLCLLISACTAAFHFLGCAAVAPNYAALPANATTAQKVAAVKSDIEQDAANPAVQTAAQITLTVGGDLMMDDLASPADRVAIANQMLAAANAFDVLLNQQTVSGQDLENLGNVFKINALSSGSVDTYIAQAGAIWASVEPQLVGAPQSTIRAWLNVFNNAAKQVAAQYATPSSI